MPLCPNQPVVQMYWTEKDKGEVMAVNRLKGGNATVILGDIYSALDVVAVHPLRQPPGLLMLVVL